MWLGTQSTPTPHSGERLRPHALSQPGGPPRPGPLTVSAVAVTPVPAATRVPVEAPGAAGALGAQAAVVALPSQGSPVGGGQSFQAGRHVRPAQTRGAEVRHVGPGRPLRAVPRGRLRRAPGRGRWPEARGVRPRGGRRPLRPRRGGKVGRKLRTRRGPVPVAVVERINEDWIRADFGERP